MIYKIRENLYYDSITGYIGKENPPPPNYEESADCDRLSNKPRIIFNELLKARGRFVSCETLDILRGNEGITSSNDMLIFQKNGIVKKFNSAGLKETFIIKEKGKGGKVLGYSASYLGYYLEEKGETKYIEIGLLDPEDNRTPAEELETKFGVLNTPFILKNGHGETIQICFPSLIEAIVWDDDTVPPTCSYSFYANYFYAAILYKLVSSYPQPILEEELVVDAYDEVWEFIEGINTEIKKATNKKSDFLLPQNRDGKLYICVKEMMRIESFDEKKYRKAEKSAGLVCFFLDQLPIDAKYAGVLLPGKSGVNPELCNQAEHIISRIFNLLLDANINQGNAFYSEVYLSWCLFAGMSSGPLQYEDGELLDLLLNEARKIALIEEDKFFAEPIDYLDDAALSTLGITYNSIEGELFKASVKNFMEDTKYLRSPEGEKAEMDGDYEALKLELKELAVAMFRFGADYNWKITKFKQV